MALTVFALDRYNIKAFVELEIEEEFVSEDPALTIDRVLEMRKAKVTGFNVEVEIFYVDIKDKREFLELITSMIKAGKIKVVGIDLPRGKRTIQIDVIEINGVKYSFEEIANIVEGLLKMDFYIRHIIVPANKDYPIMFSIERKESSMEKKIKYYGVALAPIEYAE